MEGSAYCYCLDTYQSGDLEGAANINVITCTRLKGLVDGTDGLRYHASIPLYAHGKKLGVLNVASRSWRKLSADDLRLLYTVGDMLSMAIERVRLFNQSVELGAADERNRLAREIHDTLAQGLAAIALQLETVDALLEAGQDANRVRPLVQKALLVSRTNLEEARRSVLDLRAAPLEGRTLVDALEELIADCIAQGNMEVDFSPGERRPLPLRIEAGLYRIAQEALTNIVRHSHAHKLTVRLVTLPDQIELSISDDGCGFDADHIPEGHYGLIGLNERVRLLSGELQICSLPDAGTQLNIVIPLTNAVSQAL
jgi:two-component system NarL family sensor kinase